MELPGEHSPDCWLVCPTNIAVLPKASAISCETDFPLCTQTPERCSLKSRKQCFLLCTVRLWHWSSARSPSSAGKDLSSLGSWKIRYGREHLRFPHFWIHPSLYVTSWSRFFFCGKERLRALLLYWLSAFTQQSRTVISLQCSPIEHLSSATVFTRLHLTATFCMFEKAMKSPCHNNKALKPFFDRGVDTHTVRIVFYLLFHCLNLIYAKPQCFL